MEENETQEVAQEIETSEGAIEPSETIEIAEIEASANEAPEEEASRETPIQDKAEEKTRKKKPEQTLREKLKTELEKTNTPKAAKESSQPKAKEIEKAAEVLKELKAPQSWKPAIREKWASLPKEVQQEVLRIDSEIRQTMREAADVRKNWKAYEDAFAPYSGMLKAEGHQPMQVLENLLQTYAALRTAPGQHKAKLVAAMINQFQVPHDALGNELFGEQSTNGEQNPNPGRDPRVDQLLQEREMEKYQRALEEQRMKEIQSIQANKTVEEFAKGKEFFDDVREKMGELMHFYNSQGQSLTLDKAYDMAIRMTPEVWNVMQQREAANKVATANATTQRAVKAASSIKSEHVGNSVNDSDIRSILRKNMEVAGYM